MEVGSSQKPIMIRNSEISENEAWCNKTSQCSEQILPVPLLALRYVEVLL